MKVPGNPVKLSDVPRDPPAPPPALGAAHRRSPRSSTTRRARVAERVAAMLTCSASRPSARCSLLILFRVTSVLVALTLVPVATALIGGFGGRSARSRWTGIRGVTPVAALLAFAVIYFGVMNDAGLFEPIIRALVRVVGTRPGADRARARPRLRSVAHLDGAGASTFMVTVPAMLPLYQRAGMSPLTLTCITALAAGTMNMLPWGGPTTRAATALQVSAGELFVPVIPAMLVGLAASSCLPLHIGRRERARLTTRRRSVDAEDADRAAAAGHGGDRGSRRRAASALWLVQRGC